MPDVTSLAERPSAAVRPLVPREHGAYGQLVFPLIVALASATPNVAAFGFVIATAAAFVAHEPLVVLLGHRGRRAQRDDAPRARRTLAGLAALACASAAVALALAPPVARVAALVPAALGGVLALFLASGREKTTLGELVASSAFASTGLPVALASGAPLGVAAAATLTFIVGLGAGVLGVRAVLANHRGERAHVWVARVLVPTGALGVAWLTRDALLVAAVTSMALPAFLCALLPPHPRELRRVGWSMVAASVVTAALLVVRAWG